MTARFSKVELTRAVKAVRECGVEVMDAYFDSNYMPVVICNPKPKDRYGYKGFVYFVVISGSVKIGYSKDPKLRLGCLQSGVPDVLVLASLFPANLEDEKAIHERFKEFHIRGEWFEFTDPIKQMAINQGISNKKIWDHIWDGN